MPDETPKSPKSVVEGFGRQRGTPIFARKGQKKTAADTFTPEERDVAARLVASRKGQVTDREVEALGRVLGRYTKSAKRLIEDARQTLLEHAKGYVELHWQNTEKAFEEGDRDVVMKATQWAMEHLSAENARIIEKEAAAVPTGPQILVGIQLGGLKPGLSTHGSATGTPEKVRPSLPAAPID